MQSHTSPLQHRCRNRYSLSLRRCVSSAFNFPAVRSIKIFCCWCDYWCLRLQLITLPPQRSCVFNWLPLVLNIVCMHLTFERRGYDDDADDDRIQLNADAEDYIRFSAPSVMQSTLRVCVRVDTNVCEREFLFRWKYLFFFHFGFAWHSTARCTSCSITVKWIFLETRYFSLNDDDVVVGD